jgi:hypothetical protein
LPERGATMRMIHRCDCGALDCPQCHPEGQVHEECARCGQDVKACYTTECDTPECDRPICDVCLFESGLCGVCEEEGNAESEVSE